TGQPTGGQPTAERQSSGCRMICREAAVAIDVSSHQQKIGELMIPRPMPAVDPDTAPFWEAARERRLITQRCGSCGALRFPPTPLCARCRSWNVEWTDLD